MYVLYVGNRLQKLFGEYLNLISNKGEVNAGNELISVDYICPKVKSSMQAEPIFISDDPSKLQRAVIHLYLTNSYWAKGIPYETVHRSIENSICFGVYHGSKQVGFARVVSDRATFAYLADVFILESYRGIGLSKKLMKHIIDHHELQGLRRWMLATRDAHSLYAQFGFKPIEIPERWMEKHMPGVYEVNH